jgi:hypothetical protein
MDDAIVHWLDTFEHTYQRHQAAFEPVLRKKAIRLRAHPLPDELLCPITAQMLWETGEWFPEGAVYGAALLYCSLTLAHREQVAEAADGVVHDATTQEIRTRLLTILWLAEGKA